jgi:hypothetical protein
MVGQLTFTPLDATAQLSEVVGSKNLTDRPASRSLLMIIAQKPTQSLVAPHWPLALPIVFSRKQQDIALPLMIPLGMEMVDIVAQRLPQRPLAEEDHLWAGIPP